MMQFIVIGEMISKLDENFKEKNPNIPWSKIKGRKGSGHEFPFFENHTLP